jgi:hypothetical protein
LRGLQLKANLGKKFMRHHFNPQKLGMVVSAYHPSYAGSVNKRIMVQTSPSKNARPYSKNN